MLMMEDIYFYNFEFQLLHIEAEAISVNWRVYYNAVGQFEAHFSLDSEVLSLLGGAFYLVAVQGSRSAVITGWQAGNDLAVFGRTCNWLLSKRVVPAFEEKTGSAEEIARGLVEAAFSDTECFVTEKAQPVSAGSITFAQKEYGLLSEAVCSCLDLSQAGHEVVFDTKNKLWIYRDRRGSELSLMVSEANRNAADTEFASDCLEVCDSGWYKQLQEETESGETPEPVWTLLNDGKTQGIYQWECILSGGTQEEAGRELAKMVRNEQGTVNAVGLIWNKDYKLGDIVRVQIKKGNFFQTIRMRITGVHLWYEEGQCGEQPMMEGAKE